MCVCLSLSQKKKKNEVPSNSAWGHVVEDVRLLLNGFISWKSSYCIPLVNKPARALARHARNCDEIVIWMEDFFFFG